MEKYCWGDGQLPTIDVHSTKKHDVLREYLKQYILIVGGKPFHRSALTLTLVDGFAGGGVYQKNDGTIHLGSPLIFLQSTEEAEFALSQEKEFKLKAEYIFLDEKKRYINFLKDTLSDFGYGSRIGNDIFLEVGTFEQKINRIIEHILNRPGTARRCIFLLDQYGYSDVTLCTIYNIFRRLPNAEIILTFAVDFLIDYLTDTDSCGQTLRNIGLTLNLSTLSEDKSQKEWRSIIQRQLYQEIVNNTGVKYFTNFFIKSDESHKSYWLLHLSMHPKARDEMQRLHWGLTNHFVHEGKAGLHMLGYDPTRDAEYTKQNFMFSDHDEVLNHKALMEEVPAALSRSGIAFNNFFKRHCNTTTATRDMIEKVVRELYAQKDLEIFTPNGNRKKTDCRLNDHDIVKLQRQIYLWPNIK